MKFTQKQIDSIIEGVYSGKYTSRKLPKKYYSAFRDEFRDKIKDGYGKGELLDSLKESTDYFSAAKTYQMVREMEVAAATLGAVDAYTEAATNIFNRYTNAWGDAELNTCLQQSLQAQKWHEIIDDVDLFPNLQYVTVGDACVICRPFDGVIAPVNSPFWKTHYPTLHYNCLCLAIQLDSSRKPTKQSEIDALTEEVDPKMSDVFKDNVGISGEVFNKKHPYFDVPKKDKKFAKNGFGLV